MSEKLKPTAPAGERTYARFTMLGYYTPAAAAQKGRSCQTFREDITKLQYGNRGKMCQHYHGFAVLWMKYVESKYQFKTVIFYDNYKRIKEGGGQQDQQVLKIVIDKGKENFFPDERALYEYFDEATNMPLNIPLNHPEYKNPNV